MIPLTPNSKRCAAVMLVAPNWEYIVDMVYWENESTYFITNQIPIPKGTIKKLLGYEMKVNQKPVRLEDL